MWVVTSWPCADEWEKGLRRGDNSICQNLMRSFQDFRLHISFEISSYRYLSQDLQKSIKKNQKNRRLPSIQPTDVFSSFMPTGVLPSTFCQAFSNFKFPAHISLRFSQTDDISIISTYRRSLEDLPKSLKQNAKEKKTFRYFLRYFRLPTSFWKSHIPTTFSWPSDLFSKKMRLK